MGATPTSSTGLFSQFGDTQMGDTMPPVQADTAAPIKPPTDDPQSYAQPPEVEAELYKALVRRGKNGGPAEIKLSREEEDILGQHIENDFWSSELSTRAFKLNMREMWKNWRGTKEKKDFPFEGASNVKVPLTSSYIETMKARIIKALLAGDRVTALSRYDRTTSTDVEELNDWYQWELTEVVKLRLHLEDVIHNTLTTGIGLSIPAYCNETQFLHCRREFDLLDEGQQLSFLIKQAVEQIVEDTVESEWGTDEPSVVEEDQGKGKFKLNDGGRIEFSLEVKENSPNPPRLIADIWRRQTMFDGVKLHNVNLEDLCVVNTAGTVDEIPFLGIRQFVDLPTYRQHVENKFFIDYGDEENRRIASMSDIMIGEYIEREQTNLQDAEEGTDSQDVTTNEPDRKYLEVYRWEGWWRKGITNNDDVFEGLLEEAQQFVVWWAVRPKRILRIKRLEDVNKDAKRSAIKYDFIREPGRFFSMGLAEWVRHSQAELDAIHNQRLDAGLLTNVPFFFYKGSAGIPGQTVKIEPGKGIKVNDPMGVNFPKTQFNPVWSYQDETLAFRYAGQQAGLTDSAVGQMPTKRLSASEFVGTASALDLRTEQIVEGFIRSLRQELYRILGLYQQYGSRVRIFRVGGEGGVQVTKRFERDRLSGRIELQLTANVQQMNEQLERQIAMDMLSLLLNEMLIQAGIVDARTIYQAINKLVKSFNYDGVKLNEPPVPEKSDPPWIEEQQIMTGQKPIGPTMDENHQEHLSHHARTMTDNSVIRKWSPAARQAMEQHVQETIKMQQAKQLLVQQQKIAAVQMAQRMEEGGVRPGKTGQKNPGGNAGAGSEAEGVDGSQMEDAA